MSLYFHDKSIIIMISLNHSHFSLIYFDMFASQAYEGDSICNEIALITPPTHRLELYTIYGMKEQGFTFRMVHKTLFYHSYLSSYRL